MFKNNSIIIADNNKIEIHYRECETILSGFLYIEDFLSGEESVRRFIDIYRLSGIAEAVKHLKGCYFISFLDETNNKFLFFNDYSGFYRIFRKDGYFSNNILDFKEKNNIQRINYDSLSEFMAFGTCFGRKTILNGITSIDPAIIYIMDKEGKIEELIKIQPKASDPSIYFKKLVHAISSINTVSDLTAGFDSRVITCALKANNASFSTFTSGAISGDEFKIASKIAAKLNLEHYSLDNEFNHLPDSSEIFLKSPVPIDLCSFSRTDTILKYKKDNGFDLSINGVGGELFRNFFLFQELPFTSNLNFKRLYNLRFHPIRMNTSWLSGMLSDSHKGMFNRINEDVKSLTTDNIVSTIDAIWRDYKIPAVAGNIASYSLKNYCLVYSPFMERSMLIYASSLKYTDRYFDLWARKFLTKLYPDIAKILTDHDSTVSSEPEYITADIVRLFQNRVKRIIRKISHNTSGNSPFLELKLKSEFFQKFRDSNEFSNAVQFFIDNNMIAKNTKCNNISDQFIGRILYLSYFFST